MNDPSMTFADVFACTHEAPKCSLNFTWVFGFWRDPTEKEQKESPNTISILEDGLLMPHRWMRIQHCGLGFEVVKEEDFCAECKQKREVKKNADSTYSKH